MRKGINMKKTFTYKELVEISQEMVYLYSWFSMGGKWNDPRQLDGWVKLRVDLRLKNGAGQDTFTETPVPILYPELRKKRRLFG